MTLNLQCPTCSAPVTWDEAFPDRPFCSPRTTVITYQHHLSHSTRAQSLRFIGIPILFQVHILFYAAGGTSGTSFRHVPW